MFRSSVQRLLEHFVSLLNDTELDMVQLLAPRRLHDLFVEECALTTVARE